jgi:hypothetical protein
MPRAHTDATDFTEFTLSEAEGFRVTLTVLSPEPGIPCMYGVRMANDSFNCYIPQGHTIINKILLVSYQ